MDSESWRERVSEIRWPDEKAGPYLVTVGWRLLGERWEPVGLTTTIVPEKGSRPLHTTDLRALRLPAIVARATVELRRGLAAERRQMLATRKTPTSRSEYRKSLLAKRLADEALQAAQPRRPGRPTTPSAELQRVARIYAEAYREHRPPTKAVAAKLGLGYSAAAKRVAACRRAGFLGEAEQGKASVGMLMGRGDSATLASQIAIDEAMALRRDGVDDGFKSDGANES